MTHRLRDIAAALGAEFEGDGDWQVGRAAEPAEAGPDDLALAMDTSYAEGLSNGAARVAVLWPGADWQAMGLAGAIFVRRPRFAMARLTGLFDTPPDIAPGIHASSVIGDDAVIGDGAAIGPFVQIGSGVRIGRNARIEGHVTIAAGAVVGDDALIHSGVRIGAGVSIGDRFIAHYNAVIGSDGFSFVTPEPGSVERARATLGADSRAKAQSYVRIASNGSVRVGDDVEIGACSTIDKGTVANTIVGRGTKIDNHVQIGHNVRTGKDCLLCAHAAVAGSSVLGDRVVLGGQAGVADHLVLGDDVIAAGASAILSNVPKGRVVMGYPAMKMDLNIDAYKALRRLPRLLEKLRLAQKSVSSDGGTG
jgi:UDP-3-O-[3-hydroxymyristoyl] glucosamine N-acyltransferase